jgi:hypothetical protein
MKRNYISLLLLLLPFCLNAQSTKQQPAKQQLCGFEKLFAVKPGMDMPASIAALSKNSKITLLSQTQDKLKPYASGGDSIVHDVITYRIDSSACFHGRNNLIRFEFADGKLYKAYLESSYGEKEYADMMANFDFLHSEILKSWKYQKQITIAGGSASGMGYIFNKTQDKKAKVNMCQLQYVKTDSRNVETDMYKLEVLWANLNNTRMENSMY